MSTISIKQGDALNVVETISGLGSLSGYSAKLYIHKKDGTEIDVITGTINDLVITYAIKNEDSKIFPVGVHDFETKIFNASDLVYTPSKGLIIIGNTLVNDPS